MRSIGEFQRRDRGAEVHQQDLSGGAAGSHLTHVDTDFPMFRLGDAYLMYAEAVLRGGGGSRAQALTYVNQLRTRALGNASGAVTDAQPAPISSWMSGAGNCCGSEPPADRPGPVWGGFTGGSYLWAWKGGSAAGTGTASHLDLYPLPANELVANLNLTALGLLSRGRCRGFQRPESRRRNAAGLRAVRTRHDALHFVFPPNPPDSGAAGRRRAGRLRGGDGDPPPTGSLVARSAESVAAIPASGSHAAAGDVFVHLFEWRWTDIAAECENVLGPAGFHAVQVSPPQEHSLEPPNYPWSERYQPVSLQRGAEPIRHRVTSLRAMVTRCRTAGVGIIVDAVINHMTNFPSPGVGSNGTSYSKYEYPGLYTQADFHPPCGITDYSNAANVQDW
ncbi:MAG: RagB/SusD family nutrient uptake outer membrane protein [Gemmatimonadales bacterium]